MFSKPLFKREVKANYKLLLFMLAVMLMYEAIVSAMFDPDLGKGLKAFTESMPELFALVGMSTFSPILIEFLGDILYGLILVIFPLIMIMLLAHRLMARYIDKGSMAYLIATPNSRKKVISTQILAMQISILCMVVFAYISLIIVNQIMFPGKMDVLKLLYLNFGLYSLLVFFSGICFCSASIFNEAKCADGIGIGLCVAFILLKMVSQLGKTAEFLRYINPMTLFDTKALVAVQTGGFVKCGILLAGGVVLYAVSIRVFCRRDLSL